MTEQEDRTDNPTGLRDKEIETEVLGIKCIHDTHSYTFRLPSEESKSIFQINSLHRKIYNLQGNYTIGLSERMVELIKIFRFLSENHIDPNLCSTDFLCELIERILKRKKASHIMKSSEVKSYHTVRIRQIAYLVKTISDLDFKVHYIITSEVKIKTDLNQKLEEMKENE